MEVSPPTDLQYDRSVQEWRFSFMDSPNASVAGLLSDVLLDDPSENHPWEQSFTSLLLGDQQRSTITQPPADADLWILSANSSPARTNYLGVNSQSTQEDSSDSYFSMRKQRSDDLWSSEEEKSNFLASLGLGSICGGVTSSETCSTTSTLSLQEEEAASLMEKEVEVGDKRGMSRISSSSSVAMPNSTTDLGLQEGENDDITSLDEEEEDSWPWSMMEEQMLRAAMADNILLMQQNIPWERIAEELPWRTPLEVFNRIKELLQTHLSTFNMIFPTDQQRQQQLQVGVMSGDKKRVQQQQQQQRRRWREEEHKQFMAGIEKYGRGNWKMVTSLIPGRTVPQVTSHAQHYQRHLNNYPSTPRMSKRRRIEEKERTTDN